MKWLLSRYLDVFKLRGGCETRGIETTDSPVNSTTKIYTIAGRSNLVWERVLSLVYPYSGLYKRRLRDKVVVIALPLLLTDN